MGEKKQRKKRDEAVLAALKADDPDALFAALGSELADAGNLTDAACKIPEQTTVPLGAYYLRAVSCGAAIMLRFADAGRSNYILFAFLNYRAAMPWRGQENYAGEYIKNVMVAMLKMGMPDDAKQSLSKLPEWNEAVAQVNDEAFADALDGALLVPQNSKKDEIF